MTLTEAMRTIEAKGKPNTGTIYRRHGVKAPTVGLSFADVTALVKRIGVDHPLALALWDSGVHDARVVATNVADPSALTPAVLRRWLRAADNYIVADAVSGTAARVPGILPDALEWTRSPHEWTAAAGWNVIAILSMNGALDEATAATLVPRIQSEIHAAANRARYAMNGALIAMGGAMPSLRDRAVRAAKAIGHVEVDHGETGCKTPDACDMIERMVEHRAARRTRVTAARTKPRTAAAAAARPARRATARR
jgi:3-methyladenine DNA glycosylase AlkD